MGSPGGHLIVTSTRAPTVFTEPLTISTKKAGPAVGGRNLPTATPGVGTTATGRRWPRLAHLSSRPSFALPIAQQLQTFAQAEFIAGEPRQLRVRVCRRAGLPGRLAHVLKRRSQTCFPEPEQTYPQHR